MRDTPAPDLAERALRRKKREDTALALPILGVLLLASPLLNTVIGTATLLGIPMAVIWVFSVWLGLILLAMRMARSLSRGEDR